MFFNKRRKNAQMQKTYKLYINRAQVGQKKPVPTRQLKVKRDKRTLNARMLDEHVTFVKKHKNVTEFGIIFRSRNVNILILIRLERVCERTRQILQNYKDIKQI